MPRNPFRPLVALACLLAVPWAWSAPFDALRAQEIAECRPGEVTTWGDGADRPAVAKSLVFAYRHAGAPPWFPQDVVLAAVERAAQAWSACGIPAGVLMLPPGGQAAPDAVTVSWSDEGSQRNFGLANLGLKTIALGPSAFQLLNDRNPAHDARATLQMVISHEMGHLFGVVAHSRRCVDVSSYYNNAQGEQCTIRGGQPRPLGVEYRSALPTACDIQRCKAANP
jgi:hypothetical protein